MSDAAHIAGIHAAAFTQDRPWSTGEFAALLQTPGCFAIRKNHGFALGRVAANEAELLTIAVLPDDRRNGLGRALLTGFEHAARAKGAVTAFLEVAADNTAALSLYQNAGWAESGRRRGYYKRENAPATDAIMMRKALAASPIP